MIVLVLQAPIINFLNLLISKPTLTVTHPQCVGSSNGQVDFQVSGGTAPYTVSWSGPQLPTSPITGLIDGTYFLVVTDANGCLDSNEVIIATISSFPAPVLIASS